MARILEGGLIQCANPINDLAPGSDADGVLFDPIVEVLPGAATLHLSVHYNPYEGPRVRGTVETVLSRGNSRGKVIVDKGTFGARAGRGLYLKRKSREECP